MAVFKSCGANSWTRPRYMYPHRDPHPVMLTRTHIPTPQLLLSSTAVSYCAASYRAVSYCVVSYCAVGYCAVSEHVFT